jgi:hypothetical protein
MANQIARQMAADPHLDAEAATVATTAHLERFWEHEMRVDLARALDAGTVTLDAITADAVRRLPVTA